MENAFDAIRESLAVARQVNEACDANVNKMLSLVDGRLLKADPYYLKRLKRQLRDFNMQTGKWSTR